MHPNLTYGFDMSGTSSTAQWHRERNIGPSWLELFALRCRLRSRSHAARASGVRESLGFADAVSMPNNQPQLGDAQARGICLIRLQLWMLSKSSGRVPTRGIAGKVTQR